MTELKKTGIRLKKFPRKSLVWLKTADWCVSVTKCSRTAALISK